MSFTDYLNAMLLSLLGDPQLVAKWWNTPNKGFNMQCPCDVPEPDVKRYLESFCFK
jgi:hypothetical protein